MLLLPLTVTRTVMCIALDTTTAPGVSEKKCTILQYCHHGFLHQQGKSKTLAKPSTWSGDNGGTKHSGHPLWQLSGTTVVGGSLETFGSAEGTVHQGGWVWRC